MNMNFVNLKSKINYSLFLNIVFDNLISYYIISILIKNIQIPILFDKYDGIISWLTLENIYPRFDYLKFLIISLILLANFIYNLNKRESVYMNLYNRLFHQRLTFSYEFFITSIIFFIAIISLIVTFFETTVLELKQIDAFGMGQIMGYTANAIRNSEYLSPGFFVHGSFQDLYISLASIFFGDFSMKMMIFMSDIVEGIVLVIFFIAITFYLSFNSEIKFYLRLIIITAIIIIFHQILFINFFAGDSYLLEVAFLFLFFILFMYSKNNIVKNVFGFLIGISIVLGFLVNFATAVVCLITIIFMTPLIFLHKKIFKIWISSITLGLIASLIVLISIFGYDQFNLYVGNITYLLKYSAVLFNWPLYHPLHDPTGNVWRWSFIDISLDIYKFIFIQLVCVIYFINAYIKNKKSFFVNEKYLCLFFIQLTCLFYFRSALEGSDRGHVTVGILPNYILFCLLTYEYALLFFTKNNFQRLVIFKEKKFFQLLIIVSIVFALSLWQPLIRYHYGAFLLTPFKDDRTNFELLSNPQQNLYNYLKNNIDKEKDYLYAMNNEALWYHLLETPSSSWCIIPYYCGRTELDQEKIINDLQKNTPKFIIMDSNYYGNNFDGVSKFNTYYLIIDYILKNYIPHKNFDDYSIWKVGNFNNHKKNNINAKINFSKDNSFNQNNYYEISIPKKDLINHENLLLMTEIHEPNNINHLIWYEEFVLNTPNCINNDCKFNFVLPYAWNNLNKPENTINFTIFDPKNMVKYSISNK